jgi:DinB superfamily
MKTIFCAAIAVTMSVHLLLGAPMTQRDREHLIAHHEMTAKWLVDEVSPLTTAQLNFRMTPDRWTIAEVVEHLAIGEPIYWKLFQDGMKQPGHKLERQATDADVLWYGIDRTRHEKTPAKQDPKGENIDVHKALADFEKLHASMLDYARSTDEDLRAHTVPDWGVDAYQCLLEISTHAQRHILQIREIKANAGYPKH